ncbi:MAG: GGDEF and EAL domain-containing protein [gamma proteobacterium symbiont of Taylorina sp.]|nr:GGDEF and EAL domain-containing protein [gamma proteobacterium symbiont of Taylorina sp.]
MSINNLSIKSYALGFILVYIIIFIISALIAFSDIQKLNDDITESHYLAGQNELKGAIQSLIHNHTIINKKFSNWDEVHQQTLQPDYFSYWLTHRLFSSGTLPDTFSDALIYDNNGQNLGRLSTTTLPEKINTKNIEPYFIIENSIPFLIIISPIAAQNNHSNKVGYVATKSQVINPLLNIKQFRQINELSVKINHSQQNHIDIEKMINYLDFEIRQDDDIFHFSLQLERVMLRNTIALTLFAVLFYFLLSFFLSRPMRKISSYIDTLNSNPEFQYVPKLNTKFHIQELEKISNSLAQYQNKLQVVYSNLDEKNKELWEMAHHDALTGALNRRAFEEKWAKIADLFADSRCNVSLILFDINNFKGINDTYGHPTGDLVLKKIADALQQALRKGESLFRIGGDEFACILQTYQPEDALKIAQRCHENIVAISFLQLDIKEPVRASIGISHNNISEHNSISELLWQADVAVYSAKRPEQPHVVTYSDKIKNVSDNILSNKLNHIIFDAIDSGKGISMFYQPIVNLDNGEIDYYEALLRIRHQGKIISPGEIFDLVEARKLDFEMDIAIFKQIADDFKQQRIPVNSGVSVNISGPAIINHQIVDILSEFIPYLAHYKIVLEITETSLITQINHAAENIKMLKKLGFLIALDDFGSGYSSISYLSSMPVDIVKFDISLIRQLEDEKQFSIIRHLSKMIKETGHILVAEGIETEELKIIVKKLDFNYVQGFLLGRPAPFD